MTWSISHRNLRKPDIFRIMLSLFHETRRVAKVITLVITITATAAPLLWASGPAPSFKISVADFGVYRVTFEDLVAAGLPATGLPPGGLELSHLGQEVPIWVEDSGDGLFGPGDWIELVGEHLSGQVSYFNEVTRYNVYRLRTDAEGGRRMTMRRPADHLEGDAHALLRRQHHEQDSLRIRLRSKAMGPDELWFWTKLVGGRPAFEHRIDLSDLRVSASGKVDLRVHLRGWSRPRRKGDAEIPDHVVNVAVNGTHLTRAAWNGQEPYLLELSDLALEHFTVGDNLLELSMPKRQQADGELLVDVVLLNWIELVSPRISQVGERPARIHLADPTSPANLHLAAPAGEQLLIYGEKGWRALSSDLEIAILPQAGEGSFVVSRASALQAPVSVVLDEPSRWVDAHQADYIMIAHRRLLEALRPLAEAHRDRGLSVAVVDVEDVYDEFSHGLRDPLAIRRFLDHAYHQWPRPAPRFVLLVGDASWDTRNDVAVDLNYADWTVRPNESAWFGKNDSTPYAREPEVNHRNYVPTLSYATYEGHAASDNGFVLLEGEDDFPDMAIGRFPVTEPAEVSAIVEKTIRYIEDPQTGPWRRQVLFITNETPHFQRRSDQVATFVSEEGYVPLKVYPESSETSNERHTERLLEAFDSGSLFVHFYGHGGRYIWRTGPPDLKKNHDLLTLEHLDRLAPTPRLPVVLSLTCYSAPFDHPSADSIGEKLLRVADRGAVGIIAASWRNSPQANWGKVLLEELTTPGATVGEALMRSKHRLKNPLFVNTYNLLGDPAVPVALPTGGQAVETESLR